MEYCNRNLPIHHGVYVDVFPYDNVPDDEVLNIEHFNRCQQLIRKFANRQIPDVSYAPNTMTGHIRAIVRRIVHLVYSFTSYEKLLGQLEQEFTRYNDTDTKAMACLNFPKRKAEYALKCDIFPLVKHKFEDTEFYIPNNYHAYLTSHYGNYNELPPVEKRYGHKPYKVDLGQ